jgi:four helix bundle protein
MAQIKHFEDLNIWKESRKLVGRIYSMTRHPSFSKDFQLVDHIRRTAISIPSNISEGFEREGNKEFFNFLSIAKGSCGELRSQLYIAYDQDYININEFNELIKSSLEISMGISKLMKHIKTSDFRGSKYNQAKQP